MLKKIYSPLALGLFALSMTVGSCTQYDTPDAIAEDIVKDSISTSVNRRVLWINLDGARASIVNDAVDKGYMPHLSAMLSHSKYSWAGLSDTRESADASYVIDNEDPVTWASMLTGVNSDLHKIDNYSYTPNFSLKPGDVGTSVSYFPTLVQYLSNKAPQVKVAVVSPWENLNRYLGDANTTATTGSDIETFEKTRSLISDDDYHLFIVSLKDVLEAGKSQGFSSSNESYMSALSASDQYIGGLLNAIETREERELEDWLVIVSSNIGGMQKDSTIGRSDEERDVFGVFYFNHYTPHEMKGETITSILFKDHGSFYGIVPDSEALYSVNQEPLALEFTFQNVPKTNGNYDSGWGKIIGKSYYGIFRQWNQTIIRLETNKYYQRGIDSATDMLWHHFFYGYAVADEDSRSQNLFVDGINQGTTFVQGSNVALPIDASVMTIGQGGVGTNYHVSTLRIWKTILSDTDVTRNAENGTSIDPSFEGYSDLIGEWQFTEDRYIAEIDTISGKSSYNSSAPTNYPVVGHIKNNIEGAPDIFFTKTPTFVKSANTLPVFLKNGNLMMENTMIAPQILYWFCGTSGIDSKLCGYPFLKIYAIEEQWRDGEAAE